MPIGQLTFELTLGTSIKMRIGQFASQRANDDSLNL
jgi:hypothetical protein